MDKTKPNRVVKAWGYEDIIINNGNYCGKILHFNENAKFSMHFHLKKDETWYVNSGQFILSWIDTDRAISNVTILNPGDVMHVRPGQPHQVEALKEGDIFEVSTEHFDDDSYRILKGDSQNESLG